MAQHGGPNTLPPRAHRPRAPIMSAPVPLTAPLAPLRPPPPVTLTAPRPENERVANEYVETPFRNTNVNNLAAATTAATHAITTIPSLVHPPSPPPTPPRLQRPPPPPLAPTTITKQPQASFSKDPPAAACIARTSIVCPECGRCRCASCQQPKPLPQRWVCRNGCLLSADSIIDYASCLCCVKAIFYHCSESDGGESCADEPCGCGSHKRYARWGCLGALSCVLPCLWLYWPLRGCKRAVEMCYARHSRAGCRCRPPLPTPEKRLLDSVSPDF